MKPEDILNAMSSIPEEYISEAKPVRRGESRTAKHSAAANAVRQSAHGQRAASGGAARSSNRKDSTMSFKQPVWQRVTTGIAAAAACTVFVGGGVFIAQQAAENQSVGQTAQSQSDEQHTANFLGGSGALHVVGSTLTLMYDDNYFYLFGGYYRAERNGDTVTQLVTDEEYLDAETQEMIQCLQWDGEQFYYADDTGLYRMDDTGVREEEPFYTVSKDSLYAIENNMTDYRIHWHRIQKLADGYYAINYIAASDDGSSKSFGYVYQPETGEQVTVPEDSALGTYLSDGENTYYAHAMRNGGLFEVRLDNTWTKRIDVNLRAELGDSWMMSDGSIYFMSTLASTLDYVYQYSKFDSETHVLSQILDRAPFSGFREYDGDIYTVKDQKYLMRSDPEWTEQETLFTFDETMPDAARIWVANDDGSRTQLSIANDVLCADADYILVSLPGEQYALYDRGTGTMQYLCQPRSDEDETEAEAPAETNIFGGTGEIRPVDWDVYGMTELYRDDEYYYYYPADYLYSDSFDTAWLRAPIAGGVWEEVPDEPTAYIRLLSDGEHIHFERNIYYPADWKPAAEANSIPCGERMRFGFCELFREEACVTEATEQLVCKTWHIWHIRDRYFVVGGWWDDGRILGSELDPYSAHGTFTVWFDETGTPLEYQLFDNELRADGTYFCDAEQENMYLIENSTVTVLQTPGYPLADYTAPDTDVPIDSAFVAAGKTYFFSPYALWEADADGSVTLLDDTVTVGPMGYLAPDGTICYFRHNPEADEGWGVYQFNPKTGAAVLLQNTGDASTHVCGIAENPDAPLGYEIVFYTEKTDMLSSAVVDTFSTGAFSFLEPAVIAVSHRLTAQ